MSDGMKRRTFLKVLGASGAGTAAVGCTTRDVERLIPYVIAPEEIVPGMPTYYTSTCRECPAGCGIHVETHEGRVTKVEGNPDHPISRGNTCARGQASVQGLYHPDRFTGPMVFDPGIDIPRDVSWSVAEQEVARRIRDAGPGGAVFLTGGYTGSMGRLADDFVAAVGGRRVDFAPLQDQPRDLDFADAELLVSFGADFLETWGSPVDYAWQFARMHAYRQENGQARRGRFVWVGPHRPLTGLNADQWIAPRPGTEAVIAMALAGQVDAAAAAQETGVDAQVIEALAAEFGTRRAVALGPGPAISGRNAEALRRAVDQLNGRSSPPAADLRPLMRLVEEMRAGQVRVLLIDAPNPVHALPAALGFEEALRNVPVRVTFSSFPDDTSRLCTHVLPQSHFLESWDDHEPRAGTFLLVQPAMRPVFNTRPVGDAVLGIARGLGVAFAGADAPNYREYLRAAWAGRVGGEEGWREALRRGGVFAAVAPTDPAAVAPAAAAAVDAVAAARPRAYQPEPVAEGDGFHLVVYPSSRFYDGRNANRPWLLELPDPVTKVSWESWVEMHPETARELRLRQGDVVEVESQYGTLRTHVYVYPGVRRDTVAMQMGLGHRHFGRFTSGRGVNPMQLLGPAMDPETGALSTAGVRVRVRPTGERRRRRVSPRGLFEMGVRVQHDREIAQAVSLAEITTRDAEGPGEIPGESIRIEELKGRGGFAPVPTTTEPRQYPPAGSRVGEYVENATRWGMAIDLARCIGCSACVVACNAENNIPVVGPSELRRGRELHWLRIERYFGVSRDPAEALRDGATDDVRFLPMLCQHCGNAPCEPVCPVYAAYHTPDGLNAQIYNRCVGTRYCANNCPWKVRVFNWFTYEYAEPLNWQLNPDVTVREKGVMEKCTFCVQRIHEVERRANVENRPVRDGEVAPACVQTCPTEAFVFGNFADPESAVSQAARTNRSYRTFEELNTQPAIVYLKKVTLHEPARGGLGVNGRVEPGAGYGPATHQETN
jgi:anaerobic selenocysteine-containing dehydrogenase/Fe-S-cluster-containing dehydrogenase component